MDINILMLCTTIASVSCCVWNNFIQDKEKMLYVDQLTKVNNRHYLSEIENKELGGNFYYVAFADIDFFKNVNDTYGHEAGDMILKEFSRILKNSIKNKNDFLIRWGGEEFVLFLKVSNNKIFTPEKFKERIESLRKSIERSSFKIESSQDSPEIKITSSFGLCTDLNRTLNQRIKIADKNLYEAKESGRNRVVD